MEIKTLKDLKEALSKVPEEELENFGVGNTENGMGLSTQKGEEEEDMYEYYAKKTEKYPVIKDIGKWIDNIMLIVENEEYDFVDEFISNENYTPNDKP